MARYGGLSVPLATRQSPGCWSCTSRCSRRSSPRCCDVLLARYGPRALWRRPPSGPPPSYGRLAIFGGFPWVLLGYSQVTVLPVAQLAQSPACSASRASSRRVSTALAWLRGILRPHAMDAALRDGARRGRHRVLGTGATVVESARLQRAAAARRPRPGQRPAGREVAVGARRADFRTLPAPARRRRSSRARASCSGPSRRRRSTSARRGPRPRRSGRSRGRRARRC